MKIMRLKKYLMMCRGENAVFPPAYGKNYFRSSIFKIPSALSC